jgi:hypothetical protein
MLWSVFKMTVAELIEELRKYPGDMLLSSQVYVIPDSMWVSETEDVPNAHSHSEVMRRIRYGERFNEVQVLSVGA